MNQKALPKQFLKLHGKEIIIHTLEHFQSHEEIDGIVIACVEEWIHYLEDLLKKYNMDKVKAIVPGGETGQNSIYNGLKKVYDIYGEEADVLIHDGVRPLIEEKTITDCLDSIRRYGTAITVAPVTETIIRVKEKNTIEDVIDRTNCLLARAPQGFHLKDILAAHDKARAKDKMDFIDSASIMRWSGFELSVVEGPVENIKITTPMDFFTFRALVEAKENSKLFGE
ncbi:2-C-methyl-D-erythritol 4-phosphate cytidylyltransferase [Lachnospiraceae bacterium]|nr:2-C-methyl-D-erythritol 4-phosphate cytidylyltransferase [Lachnospiraceae bacterium]